MTTIALKRIRIFLALDLLVSLLAMGFAQAQQMPGTPIAQCSASGTQVTISWGPAANATAYAPRLNYLNNDGPACIDNWLCPGDSRDWYDNNYPATSYIANVEAGQTYAFWVHAKEGENYGPPSSTVFACSPPGPATCSGVQSESATTTLTSGTFRVNAFNVQNANAVDFPTWGEQGGQDDIVWYGGINAGNGLWYADINLANHKAGSPEFGNFFTHVYMYDAESPKFCGGTVWTRTVPLPPAIQPRIVHATQLTTNCADHYCIKVTGFNFATDSYVELRRDMTGPVVAQIFALTRGTSGDAQTLDIELTDPVLRQYLASEPGLSVSVVNPGYPAAQHGGFLVVRDHNYALFGQIESFDGNRVVGWVCSDWVYSSSLTVYVRVGSDNSNDYVYGYANIARPDIAAQGKCGGTQNHGFDIYLPGRWKTGQTREVYVVADLPYLGPRFPRANMVGSPRVINFQATPYDSTFISQSIEPVMTAGTFQRVSLTLRNTGSSAWTTSSFGVTRLGSQSAQGNSTWGLTSTLVSGFVGPDKNTTFSFDVSVPLSAGYYPFRWRLFQGQPTVTATNSFGAFTPEVSVRVLVPPNTYPIFIFPEVYQ